MQPKTELLWSEMSKKSTPNQDPNSRVIAQNRRARHNYEILDRLECGIVLRGSEVKSIRDGKISLEEAYARVRDGELWLVGADIALYPQATVMNHDPTQTRKLLLKKVELRKFAEAADHNGLTLIPLTVYLKAGIVKVEIATARGRKLHDKREKMKKQTAERDMRQAMMRSKR